MDLCINGSITRMTGFQKESYLLNILGVVWNLQLYILDFRIIIRPSLPNRNDIYTLYIQKGA